jgi:hypothetical protein
MSVHERMQKALATGTRVRVLLQNGKALGFCRVAEIQGTAYVLQDQEGTTEEVLRAQIEHVLLE